MLPSATRVLQTAYRPSGASVALDQLNGKMIETRQVELNGIILPVPQ